MHDRLNAEGELVGTLEVPGLRTDFPTLRTSKERELIESGRFGRAGYGFDVVAELRHTAGTFEDQIVVSGKLAEAVTQAVRVLVKPAPGGRLGEPIIESAAGGVEMIKEGQKLRDITGKKLGNIEQKVEEVSREFAKILGVPQRYKGRADKALIESVEKALTTVQGQPVNVQQAKLAEVFLSEFARKFATRYGTKGVSVTPVGEKGLGEVTRPKSMGQLASELLSKADLPKAIGDIDVSQLQKDLVYSGNKFIIDIFSDASNMIAQTMMDPKEVEEQADIFNKFTQVMESVYGVSMKRDIEGIKQLKEFYKEKVKKDVLETIPIDVRISTAGVIKRGLQPEFMETIMGNIIGMGPAMQVWAEKLLFSLDTEGDL